MSHPKDYYSEKEVRKITGYFFGNNFELIRHNSSTHQVYSIVINNRKKYAMKIAGKPAYKKDTIKHEINCINDLYKQGLQVPEIIFSYKDYKKRVRPFFIMPYYGISLDDLFKTDRALAEKYSLIAGRFIKQLSQVKIEDTSYLFDKERSGNEIILRVDACKKFLKEQNLYHENIDNVFSRINELIHNKKTIIGQLQASQLLYHKGDHHFIDWGRGLCHTYPLKSIESLSHYIKNNNPERGELCQKWLIKGFYDNFYDEKEINDEIGLWRSLKGLFDLIFRSDLLNSPEIFYKNYKKYM